MDGGLTPRPLLFMYSVTSALQCKKTINLFNIKKKQKEIKNVKLPYKLATNVRDSS